jgi:hypothetical protein
VRESVIGTASGTAKDPGVRSTSEAPLTECRSEPRRGESDLIERISGRWVAMDDSGELVADSDQSVAARASRLGRCAYRRRSHRARAADDPLIVEKMSQEVALMCVLKGE